MRKRKIMEMEIKSSYSLNIYGHFMGGLFGKFSNIVFIIELVNGENYGSSTINALSIKNKL